MEKNQNATLYTAGMQHSPATIEKLVMMQYNTFQSGRKMVRVVLSIIMIIYGVYTSGSGMFTSYIALFLGCVLIAGVNVRPKSAAKKIVQQMNSIFPISKYSFSDKGFRDSSKSKEIPYKQLVRLIDDRNYLYLYISKESAYMVRNDTVDGESGLDGLKELISAKTGLQWTKPATFWTFSIKDLRELIGKSDSAAEGERIRSDRKVR